MRRALALLLLLAAALAGCGRTTEVREPSIDVSGAAPAGAAAPDASGDTVRIAVVTHGQASSHFWAIVRNGVEAGARQADVVLDYKAPEIYSVDRMVTLIDRAIASKPDGLVVSLPEPALEPAIKRAVAAGIPTVTINSGADRVHALGVLAHVGQPEGLAGERAGRRLAQAGARRVLCVNQQVDNTGLEQRCAGLARALRAVGGRSWTLQIDDESQATPRRIAAAITSRHADALLALNSLGAMESVEAVRSLGRTGKVTIGTFDLAPDVLQAVRSGVIAFAVDQQAYLQGYLPVVLLAQRARYGIFPQQGGVIETGPNFVTAANAAQAQDLTARLIR